MMTMEKIDALTKDIKEFVSGGGFDAYSFSIKYAPEYGNIPGRDLQLMIDEVRGKELNNNNEFLFKEE